MPKRFSMTPLALAVLVAVSALQLGPLQAQGAPVTTTVLAKGTIINGRFVRSFSLDGSALTVAPYAGVATPLSPARRAALWATAPLSGMVQGLGLGVVTVSPTRTKQSGTPRVTSLVRVLAWVGLVKGSEISYGCPAMRASRHYSTVVPPANGWQAVIVPLNPQKSIAVFSARRNICGFLHGSSITTGYEQLSTTWQLVRGNVVLSIPVCGSVVGFDSGGNEYTGVGTLTGWVSVLERPLTTHCSHATTYDEGTRYRWTVTKHGPTGPLPQVTFSTAHGA